MADEAVQTLLLKLKTVVDKNSLSSAISEVKDGMEEIESKGLGKATKSVTDFTSALKVAGKVMSVPFALAWKMTIPSIKSMGKAILNTTKYVKGFIRTVGRIAIYRAIRAALKDIVQGFQEGIQNAYQWSVVTGNQFAKSMDMMVTSSLYLKNSLGAMTMPLVNYLAPILDVLIDKFVDLINLVNQFIATLTGASSWVKALKYPAEYMEQAAGSAKELKNQLLGFDELNVLNAPRSGGSASALDYSNMFKEMSLTAKFSFVNIIKNAIKKGDWKGVGAELGRKLNDLIGGLESEKMGEALGEKINQALSVVHGFLHAADFQQVGRKISEFFSNLKLDWAKISSSIVKWKLNLLDAFIGLVQGVNWGNVGKAIGNFFIGAMNTLADYIRNIDWVKTIDTLANALLDMLRNIPWKQLGIAFANFFVAMAESAFNLLSAPIRKLWSWITGRESIQDAINGVNTSAHAATGEYYSTGGQGNAVVGSGNSHDHGAVDLYDGMFANGGFPRRGSMFVAGESGAEVVGSFGGRTGVYNADQMTAALANANEGMVNTLVSVGNAIVSAINRKETSININDIRRAMNSSNLRYGV